MHGGDMPILATRMISENGHHQSKWMEEWATEANCIQHMTYGLKYFHSFSNS